METTPIAPQDFGLRLDRLRAAGVLRFDLTESDPARCGLGWDRRELEALLEGRGPSRPDPASALAGAREAVASYLAGHRVPVAPDRIFFAASRSAARRLALAAASGPDDEVLIPAPARPLVEEGLPHARRYALTFGEEWRIDRRSLRRAVGPRTRAIVVGNPAEPTGALLAAEELAALDELCGLRGLALIGDEAFLDTAPGAEASVGRATRCLALHVSGLSGVCGLPAVGAEWVAVAGPEALAAPAVARLRTRSGATAPAAEPGLHALPALLARREPFLEALRARLARNRGAIAAASLREAPWSLQWGGGSCWAVLQINPVRDETELCLQLLDEGVAIQPGHLDGLPPAGFLVVSLLPESEVFQAGLERLERHLRRLE
jgi:aspartate/methionine/tyrosine aminotransferase